MKSSPSFSQSDNVDVNLVGSATSLLLSHLYTVYLKELGEGFNKNDIEDKGFLKSYRSVLLKGAWKTAAIYFCLLCMYIPLFFYFIRGVDVFILLLVSFIPLCLLSIKTISEVFDWLLKGASVDSVIEKIQELKVWRVRVLLSMGVQIREGGINKNELIDLLIWFKEFKLNLEKSLNGGVDLDLNTYNEIKNTLSQLDKSINSISGFTSKKDVGTLRVLVQSLVNQKAEKDMIFISFHLSNDLKNLIDGMATLLKLTANNINAPIYGDVLNHLIESNKLPNFDKNSDELKQTELDRNAKLLRLISST